MQDDYQKVWRVSFICNNCEARHEIKTIRFNLGLVVPDLIQSGIKTILLEDETQAIINDLDRATLNPTQTEITCSTILGDKLFK